MMQLADFNETPIFIRNCEVKNQKSKKNGIFIKFFPKI